MQRTTAAAAAAAAAAALVLAAAAGAPSARSDSSTSWLMLAVALSALVCCLAVWGLWKSNVWLLCALRLAVSIAAVQALPVGTPAHGLLSLLVNREALLLLAIAALLPLPLRHHCWVTVLALVTAHSRLEAAAWLQAAVPGGAAPCNAVAAAARLAIGAVVPGALYTPQDPEAAQLCWMAQTWVAWMVVLALPAAILTALELHAAQRQHPHPVSLPPHLQAELLRRSPPPLWPAVAAPLAAASPRLHQRPISGGSSRPASSTGTGGSTPHFAATLPPGISACDVARSSSTETPISSDLSASLPNSKHTSPATVHSMSSSKSGSGTPPRTPRDCRARDEPWMLFHLQRVGLLMQCLAALLPVGALGWAALELAVLCGAV